MLQLKDQVALVTGGSSGFGRGIAKKLLGAGAKVYITARNAEKVKKVACEIGANALVADITIKEDWDRVIERILQENGRVDILVNNAGAGGAIKEIADQEDADIEQTLRLNLTGAIFGCKRAARIMKAQHSGIIINVSSLCSIQAWAGWGIYGAAKAGLDHFTKHLYVELRPYGVRVTTILPSWGATGFQEAANLPSFDQEVAIKTIHPDELGSVVVDICKLPQHLVIPEIRLLPMVQEIQAY